MTIEDKKKELYQKWTYLNQLAFSTDDFEIGRDIKEKEDEFYRKYIFYKNYLEAKGRLNEQEKSKGGSNKKAAL